YRNLLPQVLIGISMCTWAKRDSGWRSSSDRGTTAPVQASGGAAPGGELRSRNGSIQPAPGLIMFFMTWGTSISTVSVISALLTPHGFCSIMPTTTWIATSMEWPMEGRQELD